MYITMHYRDSTQTQVKIRVNVERIIYFLDRASGAKLVLTGSEPLYVLETSDTILRRIQEVIGASNG